ncbi:hypothetical protein [Deefgea salmonis]|uniref:Uncharacterized protein n=1 Tax=Deefgea salmonis TaxID=2875502 RepID=A0ABS8BJE5_9NEIS|nr:hypothetical protein [Deefgea salmonis]MCB5195691.1 hypothetical protein [Deefgea salmonis]
MFNSKILVTLQAAIFITFAGLAHSAQFESVLDSISIKKSQTYNINSWDSANNIKGVKWKWPSNESGAHDATMVGKAKFGKNKNKNIGATSVALAGSRAGISTARVSIENDPELSNDDSSIKQLFGDGNVKSLKTSCDDDGASNSTLYYKFERVAYKPVYININRSFGASGDSGSIDFLIGNAIDDVLEQNCVVTK